MLNFKGILFQVQFPLIKDPGNILSWPGPSPDSYLVLLGTLSNNGNSWTFSCSSLLSTFFSTPLIFVFLASVRLYFFVFLALPSFLISKMGFQFLTVHTLPGVKIKSA